MKQHQDYYAAVFRRSHWSILIIAGIAVLSMTLSNSSVARAQTVMLPAGFRDIEIIYGLTQPIAMDVAPDGRLFVAEQSGTVRVVKDGVTLSTPFLSLTNLRTERERGLIGLALDPNFAQNGFIYVRYTSGSATATPPTCRHRLSRFTAAGDVAAANSEVILFDMGDCQGTGNHNGGMIDFGSAGKIYTSLGDQKSDLNNAQTLTNLFGKLLRLNPDGTIPSDNPFYATASGKNRAIWAYGLRNPFVFAIQPGTGRTYINDVGESTWEEINKGQAGANYGWSTCEGPCSPHNPSLIDPIYVYSHDEGCAITGGVFYNPSVAQFPNQYTGKYFFTDWCGGWLRTLDPATNKVVSFGELSVVGRPVDLDVGLNGGLYWLSQDPNHTSGQSSIHRIEYSDLPGIARPPRNISTTANQVITFTVIASGNGPLSYQWQKNGTNIGGAISATYKFTASSGDNGAQFRCIVSNSSGSVTSKSATLTVATSSDTIFADSFESGNLSKWSIGWIDAGDLSANSASALVGSKGMQALLDDNRAISVVDETPLAEEHYRARFYFHPHSLAMVNGNSHVIFFGYSGADYKTPVILLELRFSSGNYQVRAGLINDGTLWRYGNWFNIGNSVHYLEFEWKAATAAGANNGTLNFWVDGTLRTGITGVDNDTRRVERARLGAVAGVDTGTRGTEFFDAFESRRTSYIGAASGSAVIASGPESYPAEIYTWREEDQSQNPNLLPEPALDQHLFLPFSAR